MGVLAAFFGVVAVFGIHVLIARGATRYFFQAAFPEGTPFAGRTVALFACMSCEKRDPAPYIDSRGGDLPDGWIERYQTSFHTPVFQTEVGEMREDYEVKVAFRPFRLSPLEDPGKQVSRIGGPPSLQHEVWIPTSYKGEDMAFLFQLVSNRPFATVEGAPPERLKTWLPSDPKHREAGHYDLFMNYKLFFFGNALSRDAVYTVAEGSRG